jgi:hypothetical protein
VLAIEKRFAQGAGQAGRKGARGRKSITAAAAAAEDEAAQQQRLRRLQSDLQSAERAKSALQVRGNRQALRCLSLRSSEP